MENIYADYGNVIPPSRYIHRSKNEKEILSRLIENENYGSIGLVGMQRMGKSSLAYNLFEVKRKELLEKKIMVIKLVMYEYKTPQSFFLAIADKALDVLEDLDDIPSKLERRYKRLQEMSVEDNGGERVRSFFKTIVSDLGYRVICIVDEFDYSKKIFENFPEGYFILRELAYQPENKIGFLFLSRHLMAELEAGVGFDVSNFSNILLSSYLTTYTESEVEEYFKYLQNSGVAVTENVIEQYMDITGKMPYWMDILSFQYVNYLSAGKIVDLYQIFEENQEIFYGEFQRFFTLLEDQDLLKSLYQVILGPLGDDATPKQIARLKNYGLIYEDGQGNYKAVSKYFRKFMVMKEQTVEFYPLWNRTEKLLRLTGARGLEKKYGAEWEDRLSLQYVKDDDSPRGHGQYMTIGDYILSAQKQVEDMKNKSAVYEISANEITLLNGTTTGGLATILCAEYDDCFKEVFKMTKKEFKPLIDGITSARNPYDHNNDHLIKEEIKQQTTDNCSKLVKLMEEYLDLH